MAVSRLKTWIVEILTVNDQNAEFDNIINNQSSLGWPATETKDLDGNRLVLDADGDTYMEVVTGNKIDIISGASKVLEISNNGPESNSPLIVNGNFLIWQDGETLVAPSDDDMVADMWYWITSGAGVVTVNRLDPDSDTNGPAMEA